MWNQYLYDIHSLCITQLENVRDNLHVYMDDNLADLCNENNAATKSYIESLTNVSKLSREFVLRVMFTRYNTRNDMDFPARRGNFIGNAQIRQRTQALPASVETYDNEIQTFPPAILQDLSSGGILNAAVTFIKDLTELTFCAWDADNAELQSLNTLACSPHMRQFTGLPPENEIFGLVLDEKIMRAVLCKSHTSTNAPIKKNSYRVQLIDFGEVVGVDFSYITYRLLPEYKRIPPQALSCHLHSIEADREFSQNEKQTQLELLLYKTATFEVISVNNGVLELKLLQTYSEIITHEYLTIEEQHAVAPPEAKTQETPRANSKPKVQTNPFLDSSEDEGVSKDSFVMQPLKKLDRTIIPKGLNKPESVTAEEWELLLEEPGCTSNAINAVHGYVPKNNRRLCPHYNPKTGNCFKGSWCRLQHAPLNAKGWTEIQVPAASIAHDRNPTVWYLQGEIINITPTCVINVHCFYAQVNNPKKPTEPNMWFDREVPVWKRLKMMPAINDVVLAKYDDGRWYRARVNHADDDSKQVSVFYIDYGNQQRIPMHDCARCDDAVANGPYLANLFFISDVYDCPTVSPIRKRATNMLLAAILNKDLNVEVIDQHEDITIRFIDKGVNEVLDSMKLLF